MDSGYKLIYEEGMFYPIIDYEFYKKYSNNVTDDIREYINVMAVESNEVAIRLMI